jgi:hypothetical protein
MPVQFNLDAPQNVGSLTDPVVVSALVICGGAFTSTPALAPLGCAEISITLMDPVSGWQYPIKYADPSILTLWTQPAPPAPDGTPLGDILATVVFNKLIADGKLPAGTLQTN